MSYLNATAGGFSKAESLNLMFVWTFQCSSLLGSLIIIIVFGTNPERNYIGRSRWIPEEGMSDLDGPYLQAQRTEYGLISELIARLIAHLGGLIWANYQNSRR